MTEAEMRKTLEDVTSALENGWNSVRRSARTISILYAQGSATCQDIAAYNLTALAIYNTQKAMLEFLRAQGVTGLPGAPPTPTLFSWKGQTGALVSCPAQLGMQLGAPAIVPAATPLPPDSLRITTGTPAPSDPSVTVADIAQRNGLGAPPLGILLVLCGVGFSIGLTIGYTFTDWLVRSSMNRRVMFEVQTRAEAHEKWWAARAGCVNDCTSKGDSQSTCFDRCSRLLPSPDLRPTLDPPRWGFWSLAGLGLVGVVVGVLLYRRHARRTGVAGVIEEGETEVDVLGGPTLATWAAKAA